jgi:two-component system OmpR family sensor kinase
MSSLKQQLNIWIVGMLTVVGLLASAISFYFAEAEANTFLDQQLQEIARSVDEGSQLPAMQANFRRENAAEQARAFVIQVWVEKQPVVTSRPNFALPRNAATGFSDLIWDKAQWRVYTMVHKHRTVQVSQAEAVRTQIATQSALSVLLPVLVLIPLSWLLVVMAISRLLRPLQAVTTAAIKRDINSDAPLPTENVPTEVQPLIQALNDLIARLSKALQLQRQFLSDAAHGLRTPLAALQLQIENLSQHKSREDLAIRIDEMRRGAQRASHMVRQLLQIARYDAQNKPIARSEIRLDEQVKACIAELIPLAEHRGIDLGMIHTESAVVWANPDDLRNLVSNIIDNAVRYTPQGGKVDISIQLSESTAVVEVADTGPGIPTADLPRVFDRFFRAAGQEIEGTGIGLAIVKTIAEREHIQVALINREDRPGLRARLEFKLIK